MIFDTNYAVIRTDLQLIDSTMCRLDVNFRVFCPVM